MLLASYPAFPADPFNYFVEIGNFSETIYSANKSRFRLASSDADFHLPSTPFQRIPKEGSRGSMKIIEIETGGIDDTTRAKRDLSEYRANTRFLNLNAPEIKRAADRLRGSGDLPRAVEKFVYDRISDKTVGIPLIPALQVYRIRRGDCTEHAVLAVSLLRALGVPSRAIVGMYLADEFMGRRNIFVYHMWAEAYYGGSWRLVDATRPGARNYNRYIAFAYHTLKAEAPLAYLRAISAITNFSAEYIGK